MAFPWLQQETFDDGTRGNFDSETGTLHSFPPYHVLARSGMAPWRGGHAMRIQLSGTSTSNITELTGFDTSAGGTIHIWFPVCIGADLSLASGDTIVLFALQDGAPGNNVVVFGVRNNSGNYQLFAGKTGATNTLTITPNNRVWYQIELSCTIDSGAGNGTIDFYVDGGAVGSQITSLTQAAVAQAQLGAISGTAANDAGTILIGGIIADDLRVYPRDRFVKDTVWVTRDEAAFIGPCTIDSVVLVGSGTDAALTLFDTDVYSSTGIGFSRSPRANFKHATANDNTPASIVPIELEKGAYVQLTGTNPQAWISVEVHPEDGISAPVMSHANYVDRGLKRNSLV